MPAAGRALSWVARLSLLLASALVCWALLEGLALPLLVREAPLDRQRYLPAELQILAQDTKSGLLPHGYLLLLGDSHAKGFGDWLLSADYSGHPPYHSAHVLREVTGRDVLSFGRGGASSVGALVRDPWRYTLVLSRFGLEPPERIVVYFYAGNDLQGNLRYLRRAAPAARSDPSAWADAQRVDALLQREIEAARTRWGRWQARLFVPRVARRLAAEIGARARASTFGEGENDRRKPPGSTNRARIAGEEVWLPDGLQAPALELDADEVETGLLVLERSLAALRRLHPDLPVLVVYLPSVLECYRIVSDTVTIVTRVEGARTQPTRLLEARSAELRRRVAAATRRAGYAFLDPTPALRAAAARAPLHGPRDWDHPNETGYRVLGEEVARSAFVQHWLHDGATHGPRPAGR